MNFIKTENMSVNYDRKTAIDSVSFTADKNEYISIIGPNGSGKSTLLKALCGILKPAGGNVLINGTNISGMKRKELAEIITYTSQLPPCEFTVEEFVLMSRYPYYRTFRGISPNDLNICRKSLEITFTSDFSNRKLSDLSSGERQRVAIASALAQEAKIILFDEPVTHLDPHFDHEISTLISSIHSAKGITVINATHNVNNAVRYSDRILALRSGSLVFDKKPSELECSDLDQLYGVEFVTVLTNGNNKRFLIKT